MAEIKIVSGLNYGDESKGLVANAVSTFNCLNILPSNSCQRAHTVVHNGVRKVFRHFGSGTLKGAATYFTKNFLSNPIMFRQEWEELEAMGIKPQVYARAGAITITPIDMFANVNIEQRRGDNSHSSTGCGVWAAINRHSFLSKLFGDAYGFKNTIDYYKLILADENGDLPKNVEEFLNGEFLKSNIDEDFEWFYNHITIIRNDEEEKELLRSYPLLVFENGQGLLLSDDYSKDIDHNTPAYVGAKDPALIIKNHFKPDEVNVEAIYVSRTYLTRHGKGQIGVSGNMECDKVAINPDMVDLTNIPNPYQGTLRYGKFDDKEADYATLRLITDANYFKDYGLHVTPSIAITHTNEFNDGVLYNAAKEKAVKIYLSNNETDIREEF